MPDDKNRGLYGKYNVERLDGKPVGQCVVLELDDPNSWDALLLWSATVLRSGYEQLAIDTIEMVESYREQVAGAAEYASA